MSEPLVEIEVNLDEETYAFVEQAAEVLGITMEEFVINVLELEFNKDETE